MDEKEGSSQVATVLDTKKTDFLPATFEAQNRADQLSHPLKTEKQIPVAPQTKIAAASGLSLSTMAPPEVMDQVPQAVPQPNEAIPTPTKKHGLKGTLTRMAFPVLMGLGLVSAPAAADKAKEIVAPPLAAAQVVGTNAISTPARAIENLGIINPKTSPNLEAGPSLQPAVPGPLDKSTFLGNGPASNGKPGQ